MSSFVQHGVQEVQRASDIRVAAVRDELVEGPDQGRLLDLPLDSTLPDLFHLPVEGQQGYGISGDDQGSYHVRRQIALYLFQDRLHREGTVHEEDEIHGKGPFVSGEGGRGGEEGKVQGQATSFHWIVHSFGVG